MTIRTSDFSLLYVQLWMRRWTSRAVQWFRLLVSTAGGRGFDPWSGNLSFQIPDSQKLNIIILLKKEWESLMAASASLWPDVKGWGGGQCPLSESQTQLQQLHGPPENSPSPHRSAFILLITGIRAPHLELQPGSTSLGNKQRQLQTPGLSIRLQFQKVVKKWINKHAHFVYIF